MDTFQIKNYQNKKTFSSFLSGIAGKKGIPLWTFYVNRGQLMASFGIRDKNGMIMEFFPANQSYMYTPVIGFRTWVKLDGHVYEFFKDANENQVMHVRRDQVSIEEANKALGIHIKVTYFTLPNENLAALVRKVEINNLTQEEKDIEVIDGLAQILPSGIDYGGYKAVSNLLQSWMEVKTTPLYSFYKLRASTADTSEVSAVHDGNFYTSVFSKAVDYLYISDYRLIFDQDTTLSTPNFFMNHTYDEIKKTPQYSINMVPSAMTGYKLTLGQETFRHTSAIGYAKLETDIEDFSKRINDAYFLSKEQENLALHDSIVSHIDTKTSNETLDSYFKQSYLDNVLRGGTPLLFETKSDTVGYHIYSRKHGDLERDYNFFSLEPNYYAQGNGNFRDILQNRRNDLYFFPKLEDSNIYQFVSLITADGYNPLSIEGLQFKYTGAKKYGENLDKILKKPFTPGIVASYLKNAHLDIDTHLKEILKESEVLIQASFGEGYWEDHFTYIDDVLDAFYDIYPDQLNRLWFDDKKYKYFLSPAKVLPRNKKYVLTKEGKVRQYDAINHDHTKPESDWLSIDGKPVEVNLFGKILTLIINKALHLDPLGIGLSYEANKPGWNDAMNGLPGLFASGVSEMIELRKLNKRLLDIAINYPDESVYLLASTHQLLQDSQTIQADTFDHWDHRMNLLENYREQLDKKQALTIQPVRNYITVLQQIDNILDDALDKALKLDEIVPTYLTYEVIDYELLPTKNKQGLNHIRAKAFKMHKVPTFLEGPARLLKNLSGTDLKYTVYEQVKSSELFDEQFKFYKTSVDLTNETPEIGRIHAFTKGWLERESNFLHMGYKYIYAMLKSGLYDEFYEAIQTNFVCFMDPEVYGRPVTENSTFIAPSNNPDPKKHGQGFVSRLTGSTAEVISMWKNMFFGHKLFVMEDDQLTFKPQPILKNTMFKDGQLKVKLFNSIELTYFNIDGIDTYDPSAYIDKIELLQDGKTFTFDQSVAGPKAYEIRQQNVDKINVYIKKRKDTKK